MSIDILKTKKLIKQYSGKKGPLIPLLQDIQKKYGYVPKEAIDLISKELNILPIQIYEVLTFYAQFHLKPRGKHTIKVCQGTACHVMGGKEILNYLSNKIGIKEGETTKDGMFTLDRVACLGCCGMAPVIVIDDDFYGNCTYQKVDYAIKKSRKEEETSES
ncbi:NADH dehydrogenase [miscellaneous Crenarchaeota group archaeon SMTZ-80]|nr:MAG: NADH dehydrogenase [miscellaneous Crenarchaeota group archaeon SMTZ-80]